MTGSRPDWDILNAYVDGELDSASAARVARAAAQKPEIARQIAAISQLKAATAAGAEAPPPIELPAVRQWPVVRVAAVVAVALLGGLAALFAYQMASQEEAWLVQARADHIEWANTSRIDDAQTLDARTFLAGMRRLGPQPYVPDLSSAGLRRDAVRYLPPTADRPGALHAGYTGTRGCRISLWIVADAERGVARLDHRETATGTVYFWLADGLRYVLLSSGMEPARFALVAKAAHKAVLVRVGPDSETRTALKRSRATSPPCKG